MRNVLYLSQLKIEYNAELKLLERMVEDALKSERSVSAREILEQSRKVDALLHRLIEENEFLKAKKDIDPQDSL